MVSKSDILGIIPTIIIGTWMNKQRNNYNWNDVYCFFKENTNTLISYGQRMVLENQLRIENYTFPNSEKMILATLMGATSMIMIMLFYSIMTMEIRKLSQNQERRRSSKLKKILTLEDVDDYSGPMTRSRSNGELYQLY